MSVKVIDIYNSLSLVSDYNQNGLNTSNKVTIDTGGILTVNNTTASQNSSTGALVINYGGLSINGITNATNVSNGGALTVKGGASIAGDLIIGGTIYYSNAASASSTFAYLTLTATDASTDIGSGALVSFGGISIQSTFNATSAINGGALTVAGGAAILSDFYVGGTAYLTNVSSNNLRTTNVTTTNIRATNISSSTLNVIGSTVSNIFNTNLTSTNVLITGSLNVNSGTFGNIFATNGNVGINTTSPSYQLDVNGSFRAIGTNGNLNVISSYTPSDVLQIQNVNASGASTLQFLNNSGTAKSYIGFGNASSSVTELRNTMYLTSETGTPIKMAAGNNTTRPIVLNASDNSMSITCSTVSTDTSSGALKVSGGVAIVGNLSIGGALNVNSPMSVNITNTSISLNSTSGAMLLVGGLSINISSGNGNATSYTQGGGLTINGGAAIYQDTFIGGTLDIKSGSNNLNPVKIQSIQLYSNYNNGAYSVIGSGDLNRTSMSFTPIRFTGWNDQNNPKMTINTNTIDLFNQLNSIATSNTLGSIYTLTTQGNAFVGIRNTAPAFTFDINGDLNFTGSIYKSGVLYVGSQWTSTVGNISYTSGSVVSTNLQVTNATIGVINNPSGITTSNINFTGNLYQNGIPYLGSQWTTTAGNLSYTSGNVIISNQLSTGSIIATYITSGGVYVNGTISSGTLQVNGDINFSGNLYQNGTLFTSGTGGSGSGGSSQWTTSGANIFYTTGNVGINTTSPSFPLDVNGIIRGTGLSITGTQNSLNSTTGQYIFNSVSISSTSDVRSITEGGALTIAGGAAITKGLAIGGNLNLSGISTEISGRATAGNSVNTATNVSNLIFPNANIRSFNLYIQVQLLATTNLYALYTISGIQNSSGWTINNSYTGDNTGLIFTINSSTGQIQYTSGTSTGWISTTLSYNYTSYSISGNYIQSAPPTSGNYTVTQNLTVMGNTIMSNSILSSGAFTAVNGIISNANVTGLIFDPLIYRSFSIIMGVSLLRTSGGNFNAQYTIEGIQTDSGWSIYVTELGDSIDLTFSIVSGTGQIRYTVSSSYSNFSSLIFTYSNTAIYIFGGTSVGFISGVPSFSSINNALITNATITNTLFTNLSIGNMSVANTYLVNTSVANSTLTNATITNTLFTNLTASNLAVSSINMGIASIYSGSFSAVNNQTSAANITGLLFINTNIRYFEVTMTVNIITTLPSTLNSVYTFKGNYTDSGWVFYQTNLGDNTGTVFTLTSGGQIQYTTTNISNWSSTIFKYLVNQFFS